MQILLSVMLLDKRHTIVSKHIWCRKDLKATKVICAVSFVVGHDLLKKRACSAAGINDCIAVIIYGCTIKMIGHNFSHKSNYKLRKELRRVECSIVKPSLLVKFVEEQFE